ncbi:complex I assembly factor ACAD9, mitochondrial [Leptidea sinapis]|uniref:complex I assembly factor ACAD9, mitochondrial n=1 Tax=Leptidea sinapis TaxID=189913 RepID=UPI00213AF9F2|nr:complex I assembly factor ACAD9, mitochondrial [Leptidea sinapis]
MNISRKFISIPYQNIGKTLYRKIRISAINLDTSEATQPTVQEEKFSFEDLKVIERVENRKAKILPFMKNVFISIFDRDLLAYPEILTKDDAQELEKRLTILEKVFQDSKNTIEERKFALKETNMYGATVSLTNGGLAANNTELLRYLEVISADLKLGQEISDHWVGLSALMKGLDKDDYKNVLDDLISGDHTVSLCIKETLTDRLKQEDFRTTAELDSSGTWLLKGEKICTNQSSYMLVLSLVEGDRVKAFLVHPGANGVQYKHNLVIFNDTPATPLEHVREEDLSQILGVSRLHTATLCRMNLSHGVRYCMDYIKPRFFSGKPLMEMPTIRSVVGDSMLCMYASESAEYFTAGLLDGYLEPDAEIEMAMCRNFMAYHGQAMLLKLLSIPDVERQQESLTMLDSMRQLALRGENEDSVNLFIGMYGLHYAGRAMATEIKQIRNPFFNPMFFIRKIVSNRHQEQDSPKLDLYLAEHLHPSLKNNAESLEYCVKRMRFACETMMSRPGLEVVQAHTELTRLAQAATEIYAMAAVLARASRAYCIGLRNAENEMKLAGCFVEASKDRVKKLLIEVIDGEYLNLDHFRLQFGKKLMESGEAICEKPTARVFW